jgi:hypothetical protein
MSGGQIHEFDRRLPPDRIQQIKRNQVTGIDGAGCAGCRDPI